MTLRVKPTPTRFPTNSLYTPMDNKPLHSISRVCLPWGDCCGSKNPQRVHKITFMILTSLSLSIFLDDEQMDNFIGCSSPSNIKYIGCNSVKVIHRLLSEL